MKIPVLATLSLLVLPSLAVAQVQGAYSPVSWDAHLMHSHYLSAMNHAGVLHAYNQHLESIPTVTMDEHVRKIQRETTASRKWLNSLPEQSRNGEAAEHVQAIQHAHAQTLRSAKAITGELKKDNVDYGVVSKHEDQMYRSLLAGESHIHDAYDAWKLSPVQRRLHPGR